MSDCVVLGDRGYLSQTIQLDLFQSVNIKLDQSQRRTSGANYKKSKSEKLQTTTIYF